MTVVLSDGEWRKDPQQGTGWPPEYLGVQRMLEYVVLEPGIVASRPTPILSTQHVVGEGGIWRVHTNRTRTSLSEPKHGR